MKAISKCYFSLMEDLTKSMNLICLNTLDTKANVILKNAYCSSNKSKSIKSKSNFRDLTNYKFFLSKIRFCKFIKGEGGSDTFA